MHHELLVVLALLLVVIFVHSASVKIGVSFPILLVLTGSAIRLLPGLPPVTLDPEVVFLLFLPPLLYESAWFTSWREFKQLRGAITLQAVGLVLFSSAAVAMVAHALIPGCSWPIGFLLGGIIAPPDAVAATSVLHGLRIPRTATAILEGESLVNDATSRRSLCACGHRCGFVLSWAGGGAACLGEPRRYDSRARIRSPDLLDSAAPAQRARGRHRHHPAEPLFHVRRR